MLPPAPLRKVTLRRRGVVVILLFALAARALGEEVLRLLGEEAPGNKKGCGCGRADGEEAAAGDRG